MMLDKRPHKDCVAFEWTRNGYKLGWNDKGCASATVSKDHPFDPGTKALARHMGLNVFTLGFTGR